jgi:DNA replication protein DnaC
MTAPAAPALAPDLEAALRRLKLAAVRRLAPEVLVTAKTQRWPPEELLRTLLEAELAARDASNARARLRAAGFPVTQTLEEFRVAESSIPRATFDYLASLEWIRARENLCLVGPAGTGKSHSLIALGHAAVEVGFRVRYFAAASLVEALYRGLADNSVGRLIEGLLRADLVLCDDLGFAPLDDTGAQLLFRFVAAAYERRSLGVASHWPFESWGRFLPEHTNRRGAARPAPPPQRRGRHQRRLLPHERGASERRWAYGDALRGARGWGLFMATGGDFEMAIDTT